MYNNGLFAADRLSRQYQEVEKVILISEFVRPSLWASEGLTIIQEPQNIAAIIELVKTEAIDLVVNLNSIYGSAGIAEAIEAINVPCIGSNQSETQTEEDRLTRSTTELFDSNCFIVAVVDQKFLPSHTGPDPCVLAIAKFLQIVGSFAKRLWLTL